MFEELAYSLTDAVRDKLIKKFKRSTRPPKINDYFRISLFLQQEKWAVYGMRGQKDGLFTCQPSESFHKAMLLNNIIFTPMVFIPEEVIKWEHSRITKLCKRYQQSLSSNVDLPKFLLNTIAQRSEKTTSSYHIEPISK